METNEILNANVLDILFEGKNKSYGAYELRKTYNKRLTLSLIIMAAICLLAFISSLLAAGNDKGRNKLPIIEIALEPAKENEKKPEQLPPPHKKRATPIARVIKLTPSKIVIDDEVKPEDELKDVSQVEDAKIGTINKDGAKEDDFIAPPLEKSTGLVEAPKNNKKDYDGIFTKVEKEAKFPGGVEAWKKFLERNLNGQVATEDGAPEGNYSVKVQFIVDKEGNISNVTAIEIPKDCPSCGPEAIKVIKRGPKWEPAIQNGQPVNYQAVQSVTFQVTNE
jgi:protein TonB